MINRLIDYLYWCIQALGFALILLYLLRRGLRDRRYFHHLAERFGFLPAPLEQTASGAVWLHAVSVGEVLTAVELVKRLKTELPGIRVLVSTATLAGRETAEKKFGADVFYAPLDYRFAVKRVLRRLKPSVVVVMETEIWPNLYREAKRFGCGLVVVNGRISDAAIGKYQRWRWFFQRALQWPDAILAQDETAAGRYRALGARRVTVAGNLKYDFDPLSVHIAESLEHWVREAQPAKVWIAASTMPPAHPADIDEDDVVIESFRELAVSHPGLLLILVPRKPERFDEVAAKLTAARVPFVRRSRLNRRAALPAVLLLDSIGELSALFQLADVVFMGGSLAERGGHNVLEPGAFGKPVIVGPHMENFAQIAADFHAAGALRRISGPADLAAAVAELLNDAGLRQTMGEAAAQQATLRRGATARAVERIAELHSNAIFVEPPGLPLRLLSQLWTAASRWKRARDTARQQGLQTPVISVGNLSMGGTGKTPFVLWLARRLKQEGEQPAILTRGYRRRSSERITVLAAGMALGVASTGDEAQIYVRSGIAPVGISSHRLEAGRQMERSFHPSVFLLDDGFQHWKLQRNADIVLIDVLDPFSRGVFPAGRLREPEQELARATAFVLTRTEPGRQYTAIVNRLHRANPAAPIFQSRVVARQWKTPSGAPANPPSGRVGAFCGLANPGTFWRSLEAAGIPVVWRRSFPDHHRYSNREILEMAARADCLVTTQKDVMNLPPDTRTPILWLDIDVLVDDEAALIDLVRKIISPSYVS